MYLTFTLIFVNSPLLTAYLGLQSASTWVSICLGINLKQLLNFNVLFFIPGAILRGFFIKSRFE